MKNEERRIWNDLCTIPLINSSLSYQPLERYWYGLCCYYPLAGEEAVFASGRIELRRGITLMSKSLWSAACIAVIGFTLLLTPATSEAQRRGGGGGGGRGGWGGGYG